MDLTVSKVVSQNIGFKSNPLENENNIAFKENPQAVVKQSSGNEKTFLGLSAVAATAVATVALVKNKKVTGEIKNLTEKLRKTEAVNTELAEQVKNLEAKAEKAVKKVDNTPKKKTTRSYYYSNYEPSYYSKSAKQTVWARIKDWFGDNILTRKTRHRSRNVHKNKKTNVFTNIKEKFTPKPKRTRRKQVHTNKKPNVFKKIGNWFGEQKELILAKKTEKARAKSTKPQAEKKPNIFARAKDWFAEKNVARAERKAEKSSIKANSTEGETKQSIFTRIKEKFVNSKLRSVKELKGIDGNVYYWHIGKKGSFDKIRTPDLYYSYQCTIKKGCPEVAIKELVTDKYACLFNNVDEDFMAEFIKEIHKKSKKGPVEFAFFTKQ